MDARRGAGRRGLRVGAGGGARLRDEGERRLGVHAQVVGVGADLRGDLLAVFGPGVEPEDVVGGVADLGLIFEDGVGGHQLDLRLVERAGGVAVEDLRVALLEGLDGGLAGLPGGGCAEEDAVPVLVDEALAIVVPDGVELAGCAQALAVAGELLNVVEREIVVRVDEAEVVDARARPRSRSPRW